MQSLTARSINILLAMSILLQQRFKYFLSFCKYRLNSEGRSDVY
nr:MAG TPA: hypothetical protein [Bacteriophage sp.]